MLRGKNVRNVVCVLLAVVGLALYASSVNATVISPLNGSFEDPSIAGQWAYGWPLKENVVPTSWSASPNANYQIIHRPEAGHELYAIPTAGSQLYGLECNSDGSNPRSGIQQDLGTMTTGETYTFNATIFSNSEGAACGYTISFYDVTDSKTLASITEATPGCDPSALGIMKTVTASFSYKATYDEAGDTLRLIMESKSGDVGYRTGVDAVTVTTSGVPEPSTLVLLGTALAGLLAYAWRKRKCVPS